MSPAVTYYIPDEGEESGLRAVGALVVRVRSATVLDLYARDGFGGGLDLYNVSQCDPTTPTAGHWSEISA
jgi:hypothetical protein